MKALVTGSSRGIGLALTRQLLRRGVDVFASARHPENSQELLQLSKEFGNRLKLIQLDVTDQKSIDSAQEMIAKDTGKLDILINNAGVASVRHPKDPLISACPQDILNQFTTNVLGPLLVTRTFMPMLAASALVVNMSSTSASMALNRSGGVGAYRASKAALNSLSVTMALEFPEVCVIMLSPGWVQTDMGNAGGRCADLHLEESCANMINVILDENTKTRSGQFIEYDGTNLPW